MKFPCWIYVSSYIQERLERMLYLAILQQKDIVLKILAIVPSNRELNTLGNYRNDEMVTT